MKEIRSILVANRSEIAIRIFRAAYELGIHTVAIFSNEDRLSLHRFKADESYLVGSGKKPISAYLDIDDIIRIAKETNVDAIHPGYGFLSENPDFAEACEKAGILFIGPKPEVMRQLGNKIAARHMAERAKVPVVPATGALPDDLKTIKEMAAKVGYPLMLKASWGGGGRGMRVIEHELELAASVDVAKREAKAAFGNDEVFLEKLVRNARHVEVQILGDTHGNLVHLFERDCTIQRRNQKVVERAPAPYLTTEKRQALCDAALRLARTANYTHAGTVEFLMDADTDEFYFIEVNPRIQVEHTVTEEVTGVDIVKAQIKVTEGHKVGEEESFVPQQKDIRLSGHALQCRVTTEDPLNNFTPDYGKISVYRSGSGNGIRLDAGTAYTGAVITPYYDSLLVKATAKGRTVKEAASTMFRALSEFRIRGLANNLQFLENVVSHPDFLNGSCTTRFIDNTPSLFTFEKRLDRASKVLEFLAEVAVNGNPELKGRPLPKSINRPIKPKFDLSAPIPKGTRDKLLELGPQKFAQWMKETPKALFTDTTMRDAHQSLFATRMRTYDMLNIAPYYARMTPDLFSLECWGGATFDTSMRFLKEDPWERLIELRKAVPNILFQMLLRSANAVGYTNYSDNVVKFFVQQAAKNGIDLFRVFDSLNWVENMRVSMDAVLESGALCEGTICYTGDIFDPNRAKFNLKYYVDLAKQLEKAGAHILGIKDMAGICRPDAISTLVKTLKEEVGLPIHFHTHDTSGISAASVLAALNAGCDAVDGAMDAMSGLTSQPSLGSMVAALAHGEKKPDLDSTNLLKLSHYWEGVRQLYSPFSINIASGTSDVYNHEMPGGQYTNLREQARGLGLEERWPEVAVAYGQVNKLFGDIVKVTPSSKVVGDLAIYMVVNKLTPEDITNPEKEIDFPASVISMMKGELGYPPEGFPAALQARILKGEKPIVGRVGDHLAPVDLEETRKTLAQLIHREADDKDLASYLMYPKVFLDFEEHQQKYGKVSQLSTSAFFYGLNNYEEINVDLQKGKTIVIRKTGRAESPDTNGMIRVFFEVNGQSRSIAKATEEGLKNQTNIRPKAQENNPNHVGAPMPGMVAMVSVSIGQKVLKGEALISLEAMKMETVITSERDATVKAIYASSGAIVSAKDLLIEFE